MLPCGRTYYQACLAALTTPTTPATLACPHGCAQHVLPAGGLADLPKSFDLLPEGEDEEAVTEEPGQEEEAPVCQLCDEPHAATHRCADCGEDFCTVALAFHRRSKFTKDHTVVTMGEHTANPRAGRSASKAMCPQHNHELRLYDRACCAALCADCVLDHNGHDMCSLRDAVAACRQEVAGMTAQVEVQQTAVQAGEGRIAMLSGDLDVTCANESRHIKDTFDKVCVCV